jgi:hypothetical protein
MRDDDVLSEAEATRLWQRAAQLQADEARRAEARAVSEAAGELEAGSPGRQEGYALTHVRAAAVEAGIGAEFVEAALAEVEAERAVQGSSAPRRRRLSRWLLGSPDTTLTRRRVIQGTPEEVLEAMEAILPAAPFDLLLRERVGDAPSGGTMAFDIQGVGFTTQNLPGFKGDASYADLRQVFVTVTPFPGERARTEVTVRAPVAWAFGINAAVSGGLSVLGGGILVLLSGAVATSMGLGPVALGLLVAGVGGSGGALTLGVMRHVYRYGLGRGERALDGLLAQVAARAEGGWGITTRPDTQP